VDIAVVVNLRARRGSEQVVRACREGLPTARVMVSRSLDDAQGFARDLKDRPPALLVSAGGDGTAVALLNAMLAPRSGSVGTHAGEVLREGAGLGLLPLGLLPLGTGNGWANVTGAPAWRTAVTRLGHLAERGGPLPLRRFDLVEVGGLVAPFAGTGWDAEIIDDFHAQKTGLGLLPESARHGVAGYLQGLFTRTIPRHLTEPQVDVEIVNTGDDAMTVDARGNPVPVSGGGHGAVLYRGPTSVCGVATTAEWGFGFRAFPFAGVVPRRFCLRIYAGRALEATARMHKLWTGAHPVAKMHTWLLTGCKATFSRPVPFQMGGDRMGTRSEITYAVASPQVDVLDWRAVGKA
jgi:diacylglycerol kinase family enzyme